MQSFKNYEDFVEFRVSRTLLGNGLMAHFIFLIAILLDIPLLPKDNFRDPLWIVHANCWLQWIFASYFVYGIWRKDFLKKYSGLELQNIVSFFYIAITGVGCVLHNSVYQSLLVPVLFMGFALVFVRLKDYIFSAGLMLLYYIAGRINTTVQPGGQEMWNSIDVIVGFTFLMMIPVLTGRVRHFKDFYSSLKEIENEKAKNLYASKMSALGEMSAGVAHEINNPLAIIGGNARHITQHILFKREGYDEKIKISAERIQDTVRRVAAIVQSLRSFAGSKVHEEGFEQIKLQSLVDETLAQSSKHFSQVKVDLRVDSIDAEAVVVCRPRALTQVLANLISNSVDAIEMLDERWIELKFKFIGDVFELRVIDSGRGIPEETAGKMMQPFFTTKDVGRGTGLGLSVAKGLIEAHGGEFYYDASCPHTCFVIRLPQNAAYQNLPTAA